MSGAHYELIRAMCASKSLPPVRTLRRQAWLTCLTAGGAEEVQRAIKLFPLRVINGGAARALAGLVAMDAGGSWGLPPCTRPAESCGVCLLSCCVGTTCLQSPIGLFGNPSGLPRFGLDGLGSLPGPVRGGNSGIPQASLPTENALPGCGPWVHVCGCPCRVCGAPCILQRAGHTNHLCEIHKIP